MTATVIGIIEREIDRANRCADYIGAALITNYAEGLITMARIADLITDDQQEDFCKRIVDTLAAKPRKGVA